MGGPESGVPWGSQPLRPVAVSGSVPWGSQEEVFICKQSQLGTSFPGRPLYARPGSSQMPREEEVK